MPFRNSSPPMKERVLLVIASQNPNTPYCCVTFDTLFICSNKKLLQYTEFNELSNNVINVNRGLFSSLSYSMKKIHRIIYLKENGNLNVEWCLVNCQAEPIIIKHTKDRPGLKCNMLYLLNSLSVSVHRNDRIVAKHVGNNDVRLCAWFNYV